MRDISIVHDDTTESKLTDKLAFYLPNCNSFLGSDFWIRNNL